MRSTLHLKFILLYIIFGFLSIFTVATLTSELLANELEQSTSSELYREANLTATEFLPGYFSEEESFMDVHTHLRAMEIYLNASLWFTDADGKVLIAANVDDTYAPQQIPNFDPAEIGSNQYLIGDYHGHFDGDFITVIAPVTEGFSTKGYFLIHKPYDDILASRDAVLHIIYITLAVIYLLSFTIMLGIQFFVRRPLRKVTAAAQQYASGNLDYEIPVTTEDEIGYLSASLNYMAAHLKDMEEYQKKFVANVSHDFRSPLTSIKGYIEAMVDGTIPVEMQEKYLNIILFETERLTDLTNDLLTLNEFDTKELMLNKTRFDIQDTIKSTALSFEGTCKKKHVGIEFLSLPVNAFVYADEHKIQQVLYNLLDNAIKFSEKDSSITVEVSEKNDKFYVSVKDSGCGISKKDINKIWERFYKIDQSRGKDKKGTGLGLAIVKEIIQAHDEFINVISTEGVGTEFIFSLSKK